MKVVLFCGGFGSRLQEYSSTVPKPLVQVGYRPIIWHLMRYYAHFGHRDFILCLGYAGHLIREYFLHYDECMSNDFVLSDGGQRAEPLTRDLSDWRITFVDTGLHSNLAQRLVRVRKYLDDDEMFLANYADGLSDLPLDQLIARVQSSSAVAGLVSVRNPQSVHTVMSDPSGVVTGVTPVRDLDVRINGGFFVLRREIFDYIEEGEELVEAPFARLVAKRLLVAYPHDGFWHAMETFKDKILLDRMEARGDCPWMVWKGGRST